MGMFKGHSQALVQTYVDRCTGQVSVFSVPMNGSTVVAFYNKSRVFTSQDFQNGTLQAWLEETYLWWTSLSPCSTTTTGAVATAVVSGAAGVVETEELSEVLLDTVFFDLVVVFLDLLAVFFTIIILLIKTFLSCFRE